MKFEVVTNIKYVLFGRVNGSATVAGEDEDSPFDINWLIDKIIDISYHDIKDPDEINKTKKTVFNELSEREEGDGFTFVDKNGRIAMVIKRIPDSMTFSDVARMVLEENEIE